MSTQSESKPATRRGSTWVLIGWLLLSFAVGAISYIFRANNLLWYANLIKPPLNPPNALWTSVWVILYVLMAIAVWLVWKTRPSTCRRTGLRLFCVQLWFDLLWAWIFFSRHQLGTAFVDLLVLWVAILLAIVNFRKMSITAAWLLVPYLVWVAFASYLNLALWRLN
jgi:translocator protein